MTRRQDYDLQWYIVNDAGPAGDFAAYLSDAEYALRDARDLINETKARLAETVKRWQPVAVSDLVPGDIFKIDGNPVHVTAIVHYNETAPNILIVNDHYTDQVLSKRWMVEAWR